MRSFERMKIVTLRPGWMPLLAAALASACSAPLAEQKSAVPAVVACSAGTGQQADANAVTALRRSVEQGPLYTIGAAAGVRECRVSAESGAITLDYAFGSGGSLRVKRDQRIEYTEQDARYTLPASEEPVSVLKRAERAAFGTQGCGIDWTRSESAPAKDGAAETVFRGDVCNCQARMRRDGAGHVVGLTLRSAC